MVPEIKNKIQLHAFPLGKKTVLWIPNINKYVVAETLAVEIILQITAGNPLGKIAKQVCLKHDITSKDASKLVKEIREVWEKNTQVKSVERVSGSKKKLPGSAVYSKKTYRINRIDFSAEYETAEAEWINHPKFAHLEVAHVNKPHHHFRVDDASNVLTLWVNGEHAGSWEKTDSHFLSGKFSMHIVQKIYGMEEERWMGVFHAAGISNGKQCVMFFGESGSGKSTLSTLLMAEGFDILSDDFLPVESKTGLVYRFPAALSIKKPAYDLVMSLYPELKHAEEYENPVFQKTYRFLSPKNQSLSGIPCKAVILVKYDPQIEFQFEKMEAEDAFVPFVPDSWINRNEGNVERFVKWFGQREHYRLTYSNNEKMISTIKNMLNDEG